LLVLADVDWSWDGEEETAMMNEEGRREEGREGGEGMG